MSLAVLLSVRCHDGRYHGADAFPSPARLFQALVAGVGLSGPLGRQEIETLQWLEQQPPPVIGLPHTRAGQVVHSYVPNNNLDAVSGDVRRIGSIRVAKCIAPRLFDDAIPWIYVWSIKDGARPNAEALCAVAERLYQLGRGVDMAWAWGEILDRDALDARLSAYPGRVLRPSAGGEGDALACPQAGSLDSLEVRYRANRRRFRTEGRGSEQLFSQPPKPRFQQVAYESPPARAFFVLRSGTRNDAPSAWPLAGASKLVVGLRDAAVEKLRAHLTDQGDVIERVLVGRKADGSDAVPGSARVRIVPIPSIGHPHADRNIRRVLVEVPSECPLRADDVHWAFSALAAIDPDTGVVHDAFLTPTSETRMFAHYGVGAESGARVWRTVTPVALPERAARRRIDPERKTEEAKAGEERAKELSRAAGAVVQALRHAEVRGRVASIRVQREPFEANGERVEAFAIGTRFPKERLWHIEITFAEPVMGPLVVGDGRFLGLGVMAPFDVASGVHAFTVEAGLAARADSSVVARALRRAVMARVQQQLSRGVRLPAFFSGHGRDGGAAQSETDPHLAFVFDAPRSRLLVLAPHVLERREPSREERQHLRTLSTALMGLRELRAGTAGLLRVRGVTLDAESDPLFAPTRVWTSATPYLVTRHAKQSGAAAALSEDLRTECRRRGFPEPQIEPLTANGVRGVGLTGTATLTFQAAVRGPILLGRSRHLGGGLFEPAD